MSLATRSVSKWQYCNNSAREPFIAIRSLLNQWFDRYPEEEKNEFRSRFQSDDDYAHLSAFFELLIHETLLKNGYELVIHPAIPETKKRPDFLVRSKGQDLFCLEATTVGPSHTERRATIRRDQVYDVINELRSPDFCLALRVRGAPNITPPSRSMVGALERWLNKQDYEQTRNEYIDEGIVGLPCLEYKRDGWFIEFFPIPKAESQRDNLSIRPIALLLPGLEVVRTGETIYRSLKNKAKRYGDLEMPLVVAVNVLDRGYIPDMFVEVLFGKAVLTISSDAEGETISQCWGRNERGLWIGPGGPRGKRLSAVIAAGRLDYTNLREKQPVLIPHPWSNHQLQANIIPFDKKLLNQESGYFEEMEGPSLGDFLELPSPWPPEG
ncbi:MAG: hypothetical protein KJ970_19650 [Candidatus Eisenbacteria bacterium]|uniref:Restriction endonuclease n=1 Tax=Eiseniibacteriota bacterium TaxID=2212470 RepID=A0A948RY23_UNCEI|nr:hypothetical protein [Candidatus Eisenbacteria bacterium]MBU1949290.1 hypothetical protein [Candidatus Eisenbacteria bacterium]MBU2693138.1 hypothetical protein [Candidatus Eisenbacteria bacterium]